MSGQEEVCSVTSDEFAERIVSMTQTLYRVSYAMLAQPCDREDAVQECLRKAWQMRSRLREDRYLQTWVIRILINECRNIQRRRMREFPAETPPAAAWDAPADYRELYAAIDALPEELRLPLIVKYLQGASEREGAMALGIPVTTFKSRLHRARRTLRKTLDREVMFE